MSRPIDAGWSRPEERVFLDDRDLLLAPSEEMRALDRMLADGTLAARGVTVFRLHGARRDYAIHFAAQVPCVTTLPRRQP